MKIVSITAHTVNAEMRNWVFVKVQTDVPGLHGWGEATLEWKTRAVVGAVEDLAPLLLGRDPLDIEQAVRAMRKQSFWRLGAIGMSAVSGIELALWDIMGKHFDVPVWRLAGGKTRDRVHVYTHLGFGDMRAVYETGSVEPLVERAHEVIERGYTAFKVVILPYVHAYAPRRAVAHVERLMAGLREAVGPDIEIMLDFHGRPGSAAAALSFVDAVTPFAPMFVEEPIQPGDVAGLARITEKSRVPIATGERLVERDEFESHFHLRAMDIVQPDICHCGGLMEARKIAAMAEAANMGIAPHNPLGPIAGAAALHFAVSTPNHIIQEEMVGAVPWYFDVVQGPIVMTDGHWAVPETPGLGVEVDERECARHPFAPEVYHTTNAVLDDGTLVDW
ncbi:MAG: galactonate dehydratase [Pseudomonadota bacterium]|nr:galactonate dehydratase [Pseudomonadota bacterium]